MAGVFKKYVAVMWLDSTKQKKNKWPTFLHRLLNPNQETFRCLSFFVYFQMSPSRVWRGYHSKRASLSRTHHLECVLLCLNVFRPLPPGRRACVNYSYCAAAPRFKSVISAAPLWRDFFFFSDTSVFFFIPDWFQLHFRTVRSCRTFDPKLN